MIKEETIQQIREMLSRSESRDVIAHCDYIIEKEDNENNKKMVAQLFYLRGNAYRQLGNVRMALNSYLESMELDPDGPAAEAYRHIQELLDFYNKDYYNP